MAPGAGVTIKLQDLPLGIDPTEMIMGRRKDVVPRMLPFSVGADEIHGGLHRCWHTVKAFKWHCIRICNDVEGRHDEFLSKKKDYKTVRLL